MNLFSRLRHLARTSALRLALRYALLQVLLLAAALAVLLSLANRYVERELEAGLANETAALAAMPSDALAARLAALAGSGGARHYLLLDARGARLAGDLIAWPAALPLDARVHRVDARVFEADEPGHSESLTLLARGVVRPDGTRLLVAQEPGAAEDLRDAVFAAAGGVLALSGLLSLLLGLALGWQWLARVEAVNRTAGAIAAGDLSRRVESHGRGDEFDLLAGHLNRMLARIEAAVAGMREVSDNVAHDLRRPLARLKTRVEVVLAQPRSSAEYAAALTDTLADADELMRDFDALLSITRLEAGGEIVAPHEFDVGDTARAVAELYADEALDAGRPFDLELAPGVRATGDPALVGRALANLLDNAFRYTPDDARVRVSLTSDADFARLAVSDAGPGLAAADQLRLVERYARGDAARSQPGSGLGLALARAVARAHGGALALADTPGGGLTVTLVLPLRGLRTDY